jgi:hypothetical protein
LAALLPFEPRRPALSLLGTNLTLLEAAAGLTGVVLLWACRDRIVLLRRRPPVPVLFLGLFAAAHLLSAALAHDHRELAFKFALRMVVMAGFAGLVAIAPAGARRRSLGALALSAAVVAGLAIAEGSGWGGLRSLLDHFREAPYNIAGSPRASAGSEYPNLAAAFLMSGLVAGVGLCSRLARPLGAAVPFALLTTLGLLYTYSRGAAVATGVALAAAVLALGYRSRGLVRAPAAALVVLALLSGAFALRHEVFRLRLETEGMQSWYGAIYEPEDKSLLLAPGERKATSVRVTNAGMKTWVRGEAFHLAYHWYDLGEKSVSDGARTALPKDVAPGESVVLSAAIAAPRREGRYLLIWDMVHEHTAWFSGQGVAPASVPTHVSSKQAAGAEAAPPAAVSQPLVWTPGRGELWALALGMWRERPWTGVGSDNFRWLYGPRAGRAYWDSRVFANNTALEIAATTGVLGLVALGGALASTVIAAWRQATRGVPGSVAAVSGAVLFALTIGLLAHSVVDYVLAFTGHYLYLGFLVGAVAGGSLDSPAPQAEAC